MAAQVVTAAHGQNIESVANAIDNGVCLMNFCFLAMY